MPNYKTGYPTLIFNPEDKRLYAKTHVVKNVQGDDCIMTIGNLSAVIKDTVPNCVGLAATQIGSNLKIIVVKDVQTQRWYALVNPKIFNHSDETTLGTEGCLSHPGIMVEVYRYNWIEIEAQDPKTAKRLRMRFELEDEKLGVYPSFCRILQHEIDHLNGTLITDLMGTGRTREVNLDPDGQRRILEKHGRDLEHGFVDTPDEISDVKPGSDTI